MKLVEFIKCLKPYSFRLIFTALGLFSAISFMTLGFGKTALILLCCGVGYTIGVCHDKKLPLLKWLANLINRRR